MPLDEIFQRLGIALGLGLLVGLQRERVQSALAGIRTFALITVLGAVAALLARQFDGWLIGLGALGVAAMLVIGNVAKLRDGETEPGITTEIAALLMYAVGAYLVVGPISVGIALGGSVALLLHFKTPLHTFVAKIGETDVTAIMQFVLIALVIFPLLPDENYGPFEVLNPHNIWLMVVLIVSISLGGYVAYKLVGERAGAVLGGILGGLISSTAATVSYARSAAKAPRSVPVAAMVIVIATAVSLARVLTEVAVVTPEGFWQMAPPFFILLVWNVVLALAMFLACRRQRFEIPAHENPAQLIPALVFAGLYALVIFGVAAAKEYLGNAGMYAVAFLSGLHDLDAITLSISRLVGQAQMDPDVGWRLILVAYLANLLLKTLLAWMLGGRRLLLWILAPYLAAAAASSLLFTFWPG